MIKSILPIVLLVWMLTAANYAFAELTHLAVIDDADGYTNVRQGKSTKTPILGRIDEDVRFLVEPSSESWWLVRMPDGTSGYMHSSCIRVLGKAVAASPTTPETRTSQADDSDLGGHFSPGIQPPTADASATEKFLYELHSVTMSYFLASSYQVSIGNNVYTDAHWALGRALGVKDLLESELVDEVPGSITDFCGNALQLDGALQIIARASESAGRAAVNDARDAFIQSATGSQRDGADPALNVLARAILRAGAVQVMARNLLGAKQNGGYHERWADILTAAASREPALKSYAARPQFTDATWHFMRSNEMGDVYSGETVSTRGPNQIYVRRPERRSHLGSLGNGPILIRLNKRGTFNVELTVDLPPGRGPIVVAKCKRGHFGFEFDSTSSWVARGLSDFQWHGRMDCSGPKFRSNWSGRTSIHLFHVSTGAGGQEDQTSDGTFLIYRPDQAASDEEAERIAQVVDLE
ncbi:SH3 domain-containing protein [Roseimicrobium gellanilyticum]|nr:SH3 domain-containing protein [Roseimicrobium gellanilyticum]